MRLPFRGSMWHDVSKCAFCRWLSHALRLSLSDCRCSWCLWLIAAD